MTHNREYTKVLEIKNQNILGKIKILIKMIVDVGRKGFCYKDQNRLKLFYANCWSAM